jgi:hypothetical protein
VAWTTINYCFCVLLPAEALRIFSFKNQSGPLIYVTSCKMGIEGSLLRVEVRNMDDHFTQSSVKAWIITPTFMV